MATTSFTRISVSSFKSEIGATSIDVVRNPKTEKLFMSSDNGKTFRVQSDIKLNEPLEILIPDGSLSDACLVNKSTSILATL